MPKATSQSRHELRSRLARNALRTVTDFAELIAANLNAQATAVAIAGGGGISGQRGAQPDDGNDGAAGVGGIQSFGGAGGSPLTRNGFKGSTLQGGAGANPNYGGGYFGGSGGVFSEQNTTGGGGSGFVAASGKLTGTCTGHYRHAVRTWNPDLPTSTTEIELPGFGGQNTQNNQGSGAQGGGLAFAVVVA